MEMRVKWILESSQKPKRIPPERIFVVDDEEHVRLALMNTLQDAGYDVTPIHGGSEVVEAVIKIADSAGPPGTTATIWMPPSTMSWSQTPIHAESSLPDSTVFTMVSRFCGRTPCTW